MAWTTAVAVKFVKSGQILNVVCRLLLLFSHKVVSDSATPRTVACQACSTPTFCQQIKNVGRRRKEMREGEGERI